HRGPCRPSSRRCLRPAMPSCRNGRKRNNILRLIAIIATLNPCKPPVLCRGGAIPVARLLKLEDMIAPPEWRAPGNDAFQLRKGFGRTSRGAREQRRKIQRRQCVGGGRRNSRAFRDTRETLGKNRPSPCT